MDWKKEYREKFKCINGACDNNGTIGTHDEQGDIVPEQCQYCYEVRFETEAFIQSLLEEVAQKAIGNEYSKYRLDKEMKGVEQPHKTGLLGKRHGYNQKRQEDIDTFKEYGVIIK